MGSKPRGISGSRSGSILGVSPWRTPVDVWLKIMEEREPGFCAERGYAEPEPVDNAAVRWGSFFEDAIIKLAEKKAGQKITWREKEFSRLQDGMDITCHVDGIYEDGTIHEGKTTTAYGFRDEYGDDMTDAVPIHYQAQAQHNMMVSGADSLIMTVLVFPCRQDDFEAIGWSLNKTGRMYHKDFKYLNADTWIRVLDQMGMVHQYRIEANWETQDAMMKKYREFWSHVVDRTQPDVVSYDDIRKLFRQVSGTVVANEKIARLSKEYKDITEEMGRVDKRKKQIKMELADYMTKNAGVSDEDSGVKIVLRDSTGKKLHQYDGRMFR